MSKDKVCEWRLLINGELKTSCGHWTENYPEEGICPHCKKPIRVIEEEKDE